jgi:NADPH-dependent curcumin reductase CurA
MNHSRLLRRSIGVVMAVVGLLSAEQVENGNDRIRRRPRAFSDREDVAQSLENAPPAFDGMLHGRNLGKQMVQVSEWTG